MFAFLLDIKHGNQATSQIDLMSPYPPQMNDDRSQKDPNLKMI